MHHNLDQDIDPLHVSTSPSFSSYASNSSVEDTAARVVSTGRGSRYDDDFEFSFRVPSSANSVLIRYRAPATVYPFFGRKLTMDDDFELPTKNSKPSLRGDDNRILAKERVDVQDGDDDKGMISRADSYGCLWWRPRTPSPPRPPCTKSNSTGSMMTWRLRDLWSSLRRSKSDGNTATRDHRYSSAAVVPATSEFGRKNNKKGDESSEWASRTRTGAKLGAYRRRINRREIDNNNSHKWRSYMPYRQNFACFLPIGVSN